MISTLGKQGGRRAQMGNTSSIFVGRLLSIGETVVVVPEVVVVSPSGGGIFYANLGNKRRTKKDIQNARKEYGIAFDVIEEVAQRQSKDQNLDEQQRFDEFRGELELRNLEFENRYLIALNERREYLIKLGLIEKQQQDEEVILMMLAATTR